MLIRHRANDTTSAVGVTQAIVIREQGSSHAIITKKEIWLLTNMLHLLLLMLRIQLSLVWIQVRQRVLAGSNPRYTWRPATLHHSAHHRSRLADLGPSGPCDTWMYLLPHRHSRLLSCGHTLIRRVSMDHWLSSMSNASVAAHARMCSKWLSHGHLCHGRKEMRVRVCDGWRICPQAFASGERGGGVPLTLSRRYGPGRVFVVRLGLYDLLPSQGQDVAISYDYVPVRP